MKLILGFPTGCYKAAEGGERKENCLKNKFNSTATQTEATHPMLVEKQNKRKQFPKPVDHKPFTALNKTKKPCFLCLPRLIPSHLNAICIHIWHTQSNFWPKRQACCFTSLHRSASVEANRFETVKSPRREVKRLCSFHLLLFVINAEYTCHGKGTH